MIRRYANYKDSGVEWIGKIPEGWELKKVKYLALGKESLFLDGDWIESKDIVFDDSQIRYITTGNVGEGKYKEQGLTYITDETFEKLNCTEILPGDLLISRLNPPIGRCCIIPDLGNRIVTSVDNVVLRPDSQYLKSFLKYAMSNPRYYEYTSLIARGATMQRISRGLLGDVILPVTVDPAEQTAIASFLNRKTAEIDQLIANKEKLIALYEEEKTAIINRAVIRGLDPAVKTRPSGVDWLGDIPEHWEVKRLKYVTHEIITGKTPSSGNDAYFIGDINWFTPGDFGDSFILRESKRTISESAVTDSGLKLFTAQTVLLVSIGATLGKIGITEGRGASNQQINAIVFDKSQVLPFWGLYYLNSVKDAICRLANSATLPIFNQSQTKDFEILVPTPTEQLTIITHIENECARLDAIIDKFKKQIELFKEYRTTLISEVVTGKIDIRDEVVA